MVRSSNKSARTISINDVAKRCGVSITTVSRVINKIPSVREDNRLKVLRAVKELDFQPSVLAQRLATGHSNVVALVIPRYEGIFYSFYALELIRGIGTLCEAFKLDLLLHLTGSNSPVSIKGVGGLIFADIIGNRRQLEDALNRKLPVVVINNYVEDMDVNCIAVDNEGGAEKAVDYLINLGHRRIAHITGDLATQAAYLRFNGYKDALRKNGLPLNEKYIFQTDYSRGQAREAAEKLILLNEPVTAVFVASDSMALEVMAVVRERGRKIPDDLSIVGFDDNPSGLYGPVALTTIKQPLIEMAQESIKELNNLMSSREVLPLKKIFLPTELIIRESCRPLCP
ncbi:MAG: LacI family DNA-binding transcriptional regulator [Candidatus Omnitrophota bacterium]|jgi:DNA-binding LacI/PurR family transcriptional regulator